jgi:hypothetical protein
MKIWENCVNLLNQEDHTLRVKEVTYHKFVWLYLNPNNSIRTSWKRIIFLEFNPLSLVLKSQKYICKKINIFTNCIWFQMALASRLWSRSLLLGLAFSNDCDESLGETRQLRDGSVRATLVRRSIRGLGGIHNNRISFKVRFFTMFPFLYKFCYQV